MARVPLYKTAETEMIRRIQSGEWEVGRRLPNEFGLAEEFKVSQGTMRRALISLEGMGLLSRKPGRGTIVAQANPTPQGGGAVGFDRIMDADGDVPEMEVFRPRTTTRSAEPDEAAIFGIGRLVALERTLKIGGVRVALDEITVPETVAPTIPGDAPAAFPALLRDLGINVVTMEDRLTAEDTSMATSVALSVDRHTALLVLTRVARDASGAAVARQVLRLVTADIGYAISLQG